MIPSSLEQLLAPMALKDFARKHFGRSPLRLSLPWQKDAARAFLLRCETALGNGGLHYPTVQLAKGGEWLSAESYSHTVEYGSSVFRGVISPIKIQKLMQNGATLVVSAAQRLSRGLASLCDDVTNILLRESTANLYVTRGNAEGFATHSDRHHVFAIQLAGSKDWDLGEEAATDERRFTLYPGDVLYIPEGQPHSTTASPVGSVHVSISAPVIRYAEILQFALESDPNRFGLNTCPEMQCLLEGAWGKLARDKITAALNDIKVESIRAAVKSQLIKGKAFPAVESFSLL